MENHRAHLKFSCFLSEMIHYVSVILQIERMKRAMKREAASTEKPSKAPICKRQKLEAAKALVNLSSTSSVPVKAEKSAVTPKTRAKDVAINVDIRPVQCSVATQTMFTCREELLHKIALIASKREARAEDSPIRKPEKKEEKFGYNSLSSSPKMFEFYCGLTPSQFDHLFSSFGDEVNQLKLLKGSETDLEADLPPLEEQKAPKHKISLQNQLFLTLMKLRQDFPNEDIACRFDAGSSYISQIIIIWIHYLFTKSQDLRMKMFTSRHLIKEHLPACFKAFKNVRVIMDCLEVATDKNHSSFKSLVGISPNGAVAYLSDLFEGSISAKEIVRQSDFLDYLEPGDLVIADQTFDIRDCLEPLGIDLSIPPSLEGRDCLTLQEEVLTKRIARVRILARRTVERMMRYKIISHTVPQTLEPIMNQIIHVIGFLVNYQESHCV